MVLSLSESIFSVCHIGIQIRINGLKVFLSNCVKIVFG